MTTIRDSHAARPMATMRQIGRTRPSATLAAAVIGALSLSVTVVAHADDADLQLLKKQVQELQQRIDALAAQQKAAPAAAAASAPTQAPAAAAPAQVKPSMAPVLHAGPADVTLGGFVEMMLVARSRNEAADWASNWNTGIPFAQSQNAAVNDFRMTERQSRVSALVQVPTSGNIAAEGYIEADFGAGPRTANTNESNSFSPRVRHFFADYRDKDAGWYLLFGQAWSLLTQNKKGIEARDELIPATVDGQYTPGFTWLRVPQVRFVKNVGTSVTLGVSLENPAALLAPNSGCVSAPNTSNGPYCSTAAGSGFDGNNSLTFDSVPDVIAKLAFDPGWGHYEVLGLHRTFRDRYKSSNETTSTTSVGGSLTLPLVPKRLDFSASFLAGEGIGRYGSAQLPDVTIRPDGSFAPIRGYDVLVGLTFKATPDLTLYAYGGREHADKTDFSNANGNTFLGYGSPLYDNTNCLVEGTSGKCTAHTSSVTGTTIGGWWKFYKGDIGNFQLGAQLTHVKRETYAGIGGGPSVGMNVGELSFRFYPFQK
jgi:hypothetical protein